MQDIKNLKLKMADDVPLNLCLRDQVEVHKEDTLKVVFDDLKTSIRKLVYGHELSMPVYCTPQRDELSASNHNNLQHEEQLIRFPEVNLIPTILQDHEIKVENLSMPVPPQRDELPAFNHNNLQHGEQLIRFPEVNLIPTIVQDHEIKVERTPPRPACTKPKNGGPPAPMPQFPEVNLIPTIVQGPEIKVERTPPRPARTKPKNGGPPAPMPQFMRVMVNLTDGDMLTMGHNGTKLPKDVFINMNWGLSKANITRKLLMEVFDRQILSTHTLSGKPSPAFVGCNKPMKMQLNQEKVQDIIHVLVNGLGMTEKEVRQTITTKCADENKMSRQREEKRNGINSRKRNNKTVIKKF